jgi:hypothetical protein
MAVWLSAGLPAENALRVAVTAMPEHAEDAGSLAASQLGEQHVPIGHPPPAPGAFPGGYIDDPLYKTELTDRHDIVEVMGRWMV